MTNNNGKGYDLLQCSGEIPVPLAKRGRKVENVENAIEPIVFYCQDLITLAKVFSTLGNRTESVFFMKKYLPSPLVTLGIIILAIVFGWWFIPAYFVIRFFTLLIYGE